MGRPLALTLLLFLVQPPPSAAQTGGEPEVIGLEKPKPGLPPAPDASRLPPGPAQYGGPLARPPVEPSLPAQTQAAPAELPPETGVRTAAKAPPSRLSAPEPATAASRTTASAPLSAGPFRNANTGMRYPSLALAVAAASAGDTLVVAPGEYGDCASINVAELKIVAERPGSAVFNGGVCEEKGALVIAGGDITIEGLVFRNMRNLRDGNGAGVRVQAVRRVTVRNVTFEDSDTGILIDSVPIARILVERSTFRRLGRCTGNKDCAHSIYAGYVGSIIVRRSLFVEGAGGHYIKARAINTLIEDNRIDDSRGEATSYMIDLANGSAGAIRRNTIIKGGHGENRCCVIVIGAEGRIGRPGLLTIENNRVSNLMRRPVAFLVNPAHAPVVERGNSLKGWFIPRLDTTIFGKCVACFFLR